MCRFMAVKSESPVEPEPFLNAFAEMSRISRAYDGDWQGDGWGVAWLSNGNGPAEWTALKSTFPIWEEPDRLARIPESRYIIAHARSASFPRHKGILDYAQPFFSSHFAFVFNGLIKGVALPFEVEGRIGSQKMWSLLSGFLKHESPPSALLHFRELMNRHAQDIQAMNIGLCDQDRFFIYSYFTRFHDYYRLHRHLSPGLNIVSSEPLDGLVFTPVEPESVLII